MEEKKRSTFTGKIGFVLAAAGSAIGLGNLWRFPYLAAKYGGGTFLLVYIILALTFGFALMVAEIAIGRKTGLSAIGAFKKLNKKWAFLGVLTSLVPMIIFPYYSVIGGWVTKYIAQYATGGAAQAADPNFFNQYISQPMEPIFWFVLFVGITFLIVLLGVEKGVEKASKFMMPVLAVLSVIIAIFTVTMPGSLDGVLYYITPDFSNFSGTTILAAVGQLFYSMSLAMGIMITYGSYMKKDVHIESSVHQIELCDTGFALIAGLMIVPAFYVFSGGNASEMNAGPGLMFQTLPQVFERMSGGIPWLSNVIGCIFFILVFFAALTSSISLMETIVSILCDKLKLTRLKACLLVGIGALLIGLPSCLGFSIWSGVTFLGSMTILDFFDFLSNSVLMPIVAFLTCIFVGYVIGAKSISEEVGLNGKFKMEKLFTVMIKYIAPICLVAILVSSVLDGLGIFDI